MFLDDSTRDTLPFYKHQISIKLTVDCDDRLFIRIQNLPFKAFATHLENQFNGIRHSDDL